MDAAATKTTKKKSGRASKAVKATGELTLSQLGDRWLKSLQQAGKTPATCLSYSMDMDLASKFLGADVAISTLTRERVREFFESDVVTKTRKGRAKARPTVDKARRVLRLALTWAAERKLIEKAPIPAAEPSPTES